MRSKEVMVVVLGTQALDPVGSYPESTMAVEIPCGCTLVGCECARAVLCLPVTVA